VVAWAIVMAPRNGSATHAHARTLHEQMNGLFFYLGLGLGLAAACGLRPYLPALLAGVLGSAGALGVDFTDHFHFLQAGWWLIAVTLVLVGSYVLQLRLDQERFQAVVAPAIVAQAVAVGALLFAGTLAAHGDAWWPGLIGGAGAAAREALTIYLDGASLLFAALVALVHPLGYVLLALLVVLFERTRRRAGEKYAGLRILGR
jgi:hypothetical protein